MLSGFPQYATLPASDIERAKRWYEEKLGLAPTEEGPEGVTYETAGTRFLLFESTGAASGAHTQVGWDVTGLESVVDQLRSRGVQFEEYDLPGFKTENGIAVIAGERGAWFKDSEGNLLAVAERIA